MRDRTLGAEAGGTSVPPQSKDRIMNWQTGPCETVGRQKGKENAFHLVPERMFSFLPVEKTEKRALRVAGRLAESIVDGPGLRYVLFTQGCPHQCPGCHNPDTHDFSGGALLSQEAILEDIQKNPLTRGVTFSGGEPFCQSEALTPLAAALKSLGYHLMAYSGYWMETLLRQPASQPFLALLDIVVDGPFIWAERSMELQFRGSRNQRIIDVPATLCSGNIVLHPLHKK